MPELSTFMNGVYGAIVLWVIAAVVDCLPEPLEGERWYGALYKFLHAVSANISRLRK